MRRNIRILGCICLGLVGIFLLYKLLTPKKQLNWRDFPCYKNGIPENGVLLINGKKYELPVFKAPDSDSQLCPLNLKTVDETINVCVDGERTDLEITLSDSSMVFYWNFDEACCWLDSLTKKFIRLPEPNFKEPIEGSKPSLLIYKINLRNAKDTVLHFYYYNIREREKPIAERHANYHLQIELKFKETEATA